MGTRPKPDGTFRSRKHAIDAVMNAKKLDDLVTECIPLAKKLYKKEDLVHFHTVWERKAIPLLTKIIETLRPDVYQYTRALYVEDVWQAYLEVRTIHDDVSIFRLLYLLNDPSFALMLLDYT